MRIVHVYKYYYQKMCYMQYNLCFIRTNRTFRAVAQEEREKFQSKMETTGSWYGASLCALHGSRNLSDTSSDNYQSWWAWKEVPSCIFALSKMHINKEMTVVHLDTL